MIAINCKPRHSLSMAVISIGCLLFALAVVARSQERVDKGDKGDKGFVPLFNGKDLSGWQTTGRWGYEPGGAVALKPPYGRRRLIPDYESFLWSKATYDNFVLDLEFKIETGSTSGVFMRSSGTSSYLQVQIRDSYGQQGLGNDTTARSSTWPLPRRICRNGLAGGIT